VTDCSAVATRLASSLPSWSLSLPIDLQGFPAVQRRSPIREKRRRDLLDLALLQSSVQTADLTYARSPLVGFIHLVPLRRHFRRASTPDRARRLDHRHPDSHQDTRSVLVVLHHLDGLLRSTDSDVLQPVPARVRHVWPPLVPHPSKLVRGPKSTSPRRGHPSKNIDHQQRYHISAAVSLLWLSLATPTACAPPKRLTDAQDETNSRSTPACKQSCVSLSVGWNPAGPPTLRRESLDPPSMPDLLAARRRLTFSPG